MLRPQWRGTRLRALWGISLMAFACDATSPVPSTAPAHPAARQGSCQHIPESPAGTSWPNAGRGVHLGIGAGTTSEAESPPSRPARPGLPRGAQHMQQEPRCRIPLVGIEALGDGDEPDAVILQVRMLLRQSTKKRPLPQT